jgi:hypothetical protein
MQRFASPMTELAKVRWTGHGFPLHGNGCWSGRDGILIWTKRINVQNQVAAEGTFVETFQGTGICCYLLLLFVVVVICLFICIGISHIVQSTFVVFVVHCPRIL